MIGAIRSAAKVGDRVIGLDIEDKWVEGRVVGIQTSMFCVAAVKVSFDGWEDEWDEWIKLGQDRVCRPTGDYDWQYPDEGEVGGSADVEMQEADQAAEAARKEAAAATEAAAKAAELLAAEKAAAEKLTAEKAAAESAQAQAAQAAQAVASALAQEQQKAATAESALAAEQRRAAAAEAELAQLRAALQQERESREREQATATASQAAADAERRPAHYGLLASLSLGSLLSPPNGDAVYSTFTLYDAERPDSTPPMLKPVADELVAEFKRNGRGGVPTTNADGRSVNINLAPNIFAGGLTRIELVHNEELWTTFVTRLKTNERQRMTGKLMFNPPPPHDVETERSAVMTHLKEQMKLRSTLPFERS